MRAFFIIFVLASSLMSFAQQENPLVRCTEAMVGEGLPGNESRDLTLDLKEVQGTPREFVAEYDLLESEGDLVPKVRITVREPYRGTSVMMTIEHVSENGIALSHARTWVPVEAASKYGISLQMVTGQLRESREDHVIDCLVLKGFPFRG